MSRVSVLFVIVFLGCIGFTMPLPLLPELFLNPASRFFSPQVDLPFRTTMLGLLIGAYPLGQFFGGPILGRIGDAYGKRRILLFSLILLFFAYLVSAYAVQEWNLSLFFVGRFVAGFAEGNITLAQSAMAEISTENNKVRNFSLINLALALGFIVGPLLGGKLSDHTLSSWFNFATPFWVAALLSVFCYAYAHFYFQETKVCERNPIFRSSLKVFTHFPLGYYLLLVFIFSLGISLFLALAPLFFVEEYKVTPSKLSEIIAYAAISYIFAQVFVIKPLHRHLSLEKSTVAAAACMGILLILFPFFSNLALTIAFVFPIGVLNLILLVNGVVLISNHAPKEEQGHVLGINQSLYVFATACAGSAGGILSGIYLGLPFILAGCLLIFGASLFALHILK